MNGDQPTPVTHIYFTIRMSVDPRQVKAGGLSQVLGYTSRWQQRGVRFHVSMPCTAGESPGVEEVNCVFWHRFVPGHLAGRSILPHDEAMLAAIEFIDQSPLASYEACLLMPTDVSPVSASLLQRASDRGIASVMPVHMFPEPLKILSPRDWVRLLRERRWFKPITAIHANSEVSARAMCADAGKPLSWAKVIMTGVNTQRFRPAASQDEKKALRRKLGLPEGRQIALFIGGATRRKGVDFLLKAWEHFVLSRKPDATLVLVGGNANRPGVAEAQRGEYSQFAEDFDRQLQAVRRKADVRLFEHVSTVEEFYRAADVFVFPSLREGLPNAVLEAMSSGLPVLATRFLGFPHEGGEFGYEGQHFISLPRDTKAWSDSLIAILADQTRRSRMGRAARRWMECFQNLDVITAQSAEFFHGLARSLRPCR